MAVDAVVEREKKNKYSREYAKEKIEKVRKQKLESYHRNKHKYQERIKQYKEENAEEIKKKARERARKNREENREELLAYRRDWYAKNKDKILEQVKKYRSENRERVNEQTRRSHKKNRTKESEYKKKRYHEIRKYNHHERIAGNLRSKMRIAIIAQHGDKTGSFRDVVGCSPKELVIYLESLFRDGMSWDNYGVHGWHIDHIVPCAFFDLTDVEQQRECFNYKNLQPLWAFDNLSKGAKHYAS